jgi:ATP-dependent DNA helicase RecG
LENLARSALQPVVRLDHNLEDWQGVKILIVYVSESETKPVVLRGKALDHTFIRSGGSTRKASRQEVGSLMLNSRTPRWEDLNASPLLSSKDLIERLDYEALLDLLQRPAPADESSLLAWMAEEKLINLVEKDRGYITNLGAIAAARRLADFEDLGRKAVRVIVYGGLNKSKTKREQEGGLGCTSPERTDTEIWLTNTVSGLTRTLHFIQGRNPA